MSDSGPAGRSMAAELAGAFAWLIFGGLMFWQTFLLKGTHVGAAEGVFGPVFYPRLIAGSGIGDLHRALGNSVVAVADLADLDDAISRQGRPRSEIRHCRAVP